MVMQDFETRHEAAHVVPDKTGDLTWFFSSVLFVIWSVLETDDALSCRATKKAHESLGFWEEVVRHTGREATV